MFLLTLARKYINIHINISPDLKEFNKQCSESIIIQTNIIFTRVHTTIYYIQRLLVDLLLTETILICSIFLKHLYFLRYRSEANEL